MDRDQDILASELADEYYNTRDESGQRVRVTVRGLAGEHGISKSAAQALLRRAEDRGLVRHVVARQLSFPESDPAVERRLAERLLRALPDSLADVVLVRTPPTADGGLSDRLAEQIGSAAAARVVKPLLVGSALRFADPREHSERPARLGLGLAGGRTVLACARRLGQEMVPASRAARSVAAIQPLSGTMLIEMDTMDPDACGLQLRLVFTEAAFVPVMAHLAPPADRQAGCPRIANLLAEAKQRGADRLMGLLGLGTLSPSDGCRLRAATADGDRGVQRDDVTLQGIRDDLVRLLAVCDELSRSEVGRQLYYPVSDVANYLFTVRVPRPGAAQPLDEEPSSLSTSRTYETIEEIVQAINARTCTCPLEVLAEECEVVAVMAGGSEKVGGLYELLRRFQWRNVVLISDEATCGDLVRVAEACCGAAPTGSR